ncbi:1-phosphofructokinase [Desulfobacter hydrogenophilus]|uniref:1-phosphofructokinase n=1 Tax=Desulfobacter hydrogenophilus TaxID=2291 RepID=A0A328F6G3_9BACT|nr:1-phosphofructokinase [Desulfobacter hydrogenophilus]NDY74305.1 1-phosphofructokinase [Desulfobacter hydrogenophilus]QBH15185.1 1-phosphofructokinase [Desulfobacter hydrogenophilus]RAM00124.1 1-phosphofructokinase [Desulfobacter hydrogenophilus]
MIYTVTLNPAVDREMTVDTIAFDTVLRALEWRVDCGGKGFNVARMLKSLGTSSVALGFAAGKSGEMLNDKLQSLGIETEFVWVDGETRTNVSIVSAENGQYVKVNEPGPTINGADLAQLAQKIRDRVQAGDWWVLAGSLPPGVEPSYYTELITIIQSAGAKVFLDTSDEALRQNCSAKPLLVKPNDEEAHKLTGLPVNTPAEIVAVGMAISAMGPVSVIISLGKVGAVLVDKGKAWLATSPKIVAANPIGAGDSMVAGIVWGLSQGDSMQDALCKGIACGAATASQKGTSVGSREQVNDLLSQVQIREVK